MLNLKPSQTCRSCLLFSDCIYHNCHSSICIFLKYFSEGAKFQPATNLLLPKYSSRHQIIIWMSQLFQSYIQREPHQPALLFSSSDCISHLSTQNISIQICKMLNCLHGSNPAIQILPQEKRINCDKSNTSIY